MGVSIRNVRTSTYQSLAPGLEIKAIHFAKLHVRSPLPHTGTAHAREIRFSSGFQRQATIQKVIPAVPFQQSRRVHCADEVADAENGGDKDFLCANAVELRNRQIGELI